jgi:hypothetical protein
MTASSRLHTLPSAATHPAPPALLSARSPSSRRRWLKGAAHGAAFAASMALAACGGGVTSDPPSVTLATLPTSAVAGASVTLVAVASDNDGVAGVKFYRVDASGNTLLGTLNTAPYQLATTLPSTTATAVAYFATAIDTDDNATDSNQALVTVTR